MPPKRKKIDSPSQAASPGSADQDYINAPTEPLKLAAALRLVRAMLAGRPGDPLVAQQAIEYLEAYAPGKVARMIAELESAGLAIRDEIEDEGEGDTVEMTAAEAGEAEAELLDLAQDAAERELAGEEADPATLAKIGKSPWAMALLETMREAGGQERKEAIAAESEQVLAISMLVLLARKWQVAQVRRHAKPVAATHFMEPQVGQSLGPWVLEEITPVIAQKQGLDYKVRLGLPLPESEGRLDLKLVPDNSERHKESWTYEVELTNFRGPEMYVGWGDDKKRASGWKLLGEQPVDFNLDPAAEPVWLYLRQRAGSDWKESREPIPIIKSSKA